MKHTENYLEMSGFEFKTFLPDWANALPLEFFTDGHYIFRVDKKRPGRVEIGYVEDDWEIR